MMGVVAAQVRPSGQSEVTSTATTSLTFPDRVFTASIVAVGGGGGGSTTGGSGGAGGAGGNLAYRDIASITPGLAYSITIGSAGTASGTAGVGGAGGNTQWNSNVLVAPGGGGARSGVLGGLAGAANTGATGGALGGIGGAASSTSAGGGGGAGGYSGAGGAGGSGPAAANGADGAGGGGGGGSYGGSSDAAGAGGGVGLLGIGSNGTGGVGAGANGQPGTGGSGGASGSSSPGSTLAPSTGGLYGGGGGGAELAGEQGPGAQGALRAIWGYVGNAPRIYTPIVPAVTYNFQSTANSWTGSAGSQFGCTLSTGASFLTVTPNTGVVNYYIERTGLSISGSANRYFHMTWKRTVAGYNSAADYDPTDGAGSQVFWSTSGHGYSESYMTLLPQQYWDGTNFITTTVDMHNAFAGGSNWSSSTITTLRVDPDRSNVAYHIQTIEVSPYPSPSWVNLTQSL